LQWVAQHPLRIREEAGSAGEAIELVVWPRLMGPKLVKSLSSLAVSPLPSTDVAKMGIPGTDFHEIRRYVSSDAIKNINWRATARRAEPDPWPLVNEYEREGWKSVLLFVNATRSVELGSNVEDGLEYCLEAAGTLVVGVVGTWKRTMPRWVMIPIVVFSALVAVLVEVIVFAAYF
jgi:uncharacterized protein (DUF58 family)